VVEGGTGTAVEGGTGATSVGTTGSSGIEDTLSSATTAAEAGNTSANTSARTETSVLNASDNQTAGIIKANSSSTSNTVGANQGSTNNQGSINTATIANCNINSKEKVLPGSPSSKGGIAPISEGILLEEGFLDPTEPNERPVVEPGNYYLEGNNATNYLEGGNLEGGTAATDSTNSADGLGRDSSYIHLESSREFAVPFGNGSIPCPAWLRDMAGDQVIDSAIVATQSLDLVINRIRNILSIFFLG